MDREGSRGRKASSAGYSGSSRAFSLVMMRHPNPMRAPLREPLPRPPRHSDLLPLLLPLRITRQQLASRPLRRQGDGRRDPPLPLLPLLPSGPGRRQVKILPYESDLVTHCLMALAGSSQTQWPPGQRQEDYRAAGPPPGYYSSPDPAAAVPESSPPLYPQVQAPDDYGRADSQQQQYRRTDSRPAPPQDQQQQPGPNPNPNPILSSDRFGPASDGYPAPPPGLGEEPFPLPGSPFPYSPEPQQPEGQPEDPLLAVPAEPIAFTFEDSIVLILKPKEFYRFRSLLPLLYWVHDPHVLVLVSGRSWSCRGPAQAACRCSATSSMSSRASECRPRSPRRRRSWAT